MRKKIVSICNSSGEMGCAQVKKVSEVLLNPLGKKQKNSPKDEETAL